MRTPVDDFTSYQPSSATYWRGIVLFGRNVASYKLALAKSLIELAEREQEVVSLEELADPFSRHVCEHLANVDKQGTSAGSRFLDACRAYNRGELDRERLIETTARLGFNNVIDAFHVVGGGEVPHRFFTDERKGSVRGIRITDEMPGLAEEVGADELEAEAESRWRLVETAWELQLPRHLLAITYEPESEMLLTPERARRRAITPVRSALNGYQKGRCFYCFGSIDIGAGATELAQVDHFFPHLLARTELGERVNLDGVWNLVLACRECNAGVGGKSASLPEPSYLGRLHRRNEFLIGSNHPLRETLMLQTGDSPDRRAAFLRSVFSVAAELGAGAWLWRTDEKGPPAF